MFKVLYMYLRLASQKGKWKRRVEADYLSIIWMYKGKRLKA